MNKLDELRSALARQGVDGLIVTDEFNRRYLSGFHGTAGSLLVSAKQQILAVDSRYTEQAQTQAQGWEVRDITLIRDWFPRFVKELGLNKLGFEANSVTVATLDRYRKAFKDAASEIANWYRPWIWLRICAFASAKMRFVSWNARPK